MIDTTILIPTYNRGHFLTETIENCFNQTYPNFSILIYDDGSTDNTREILNQLKERYGDRFNFITSNENKGIGYARNVLLDNLETQFGVWLDSDDLMSFDRIEKSISYLRKNNEIDIVYSNMQWFTPNQDKIILNNRIQIDVTKYDKNDWSSLKYNTTCPSGIFRKSLKCYNFENKLTLGGEDVLWIWKLLQNNIKIGYINESLYLYRNHNNRIGNEKRKKSMKDIKAKEDIILKRKIKEIKNKNILNYE